MRLNQITASVLHQLFGWLALRLFGYALAGLFALVALYHFTVSGTLALEARFGVVQAHLIVAGAFTAAVLVTVAILAATKTKALPTPTNGMLSEPRHMQIAMLVEAVMLGYSLARKPPKTD